MAVGGLLLGVVVGSVTMQRALELTEQHKGLSTRDAVHAAAMEQAEIREILSFDRGFEGLRGVARSQPLCADARRPASRGPP